MVAYGVKGYSLAPGNREQTDTRGVEKRSSHRSHKPENAGSIPAPAPNKGCDGNRNDWKREAEPRGSSWKPSLLTKPRGILIKLVMGYKKFSCIMAILAVAAFLLAATVSDYILAVSGLCLWVSLASYLDGKAEEKKAEDAE